MPEPTPAERARRALAEAADAASRGDAEAPADVDIPVAATVVILRDSPAGPEVLMIERPDRGSFAGAWVFPGGKIETVDERAHVEAEEVVARRAGARETFEEAGLDLDPDGFVTMSRWTPPPGLPLRIRTWFFAVRATEALPAFSADEVVSSLWVRPEDLLERHGRGEVTLYPPTWVTLHDLTGQPDVEALMSVVRMRGIVSFEPIVRRTANGPMFVWQGDAEYGGKDAAALVPGEHQRVEASARHRLETGALPWNYIRRS